MKPVYLLIGALALAACDSKTTSAPASESAPAVVASVSEAPVVESRLDQVLAAQSDDTKARYEYRHPKETLEFFGIQPGMTVVEALPGGGWYSQILVPYLGSQGKLIGADYDLDMWSNFGWVNDQFIESRKAWPAEWTGKAEEWGQGQGAAAEAYTFSEIPAELDGKVDAVLLIRALHNLYRYENNGQHMSRALKRSFDLLKSGGVVGIVQHEAREDKSDEWADGSNGYLKKSTLIAAVQAVGFEFVGESDINANPKDQPGDADNVWRLPPSLRTDSEEQKAANLAIGETHRMTLLFRKP
jgi:predicted methyltransferase